MAQDEAPPARARDLPPPGAGLAMLAALGCLALGLFAPSMLTDGDSFWHVAVGEWELAHQAVPHLDPFSFTFASRPWTAHEWLSELLMALAWRAGGWGGVLGLYAAALAGLGATLALQLRRDLPPGAALVALLLGLCCVGPSLLARPHLLGLLMLALWMAALLRAQARGRPPWTALPLMTLWANLHGGYMLGLALAVPLCLEAAWPAATPSTRPWGAGLQYGGPRGAGPQGARVPAWRVAGRQRRRVRSLLSPGRTWPLPGIDGARPPTLAQARRRTAQGWLRAAWPWGLFLLLATGCAALTPQGPAGLLFPFAVVRLHALAGIAEWQPPDLSVLQPVELAVLAALFVLLGRGVRLPPWRLLTLLGLLHLALAQSRQGMVLGVAGSLLLAGPLGAALGCPGRRASGRDRAELGSPGPDRTAPEPLDASRPDPHGPGLAWALPARPHAPAPGRVGPQAAWPETAPARACTDAVCADAAPRVARSTTPRSRAVRGAGLAGLAALGLAGLRARHPVRLQDSDVAPVTALACVPPALAAQPMLNAYEFGGYLILRGLRPFIDGRTDMYGDAFMHEYAELQSDPAALAEAVRRWDLRWAILLPGSPVPARLEALPGWHRSCADQYAVVEIRDAPAAAAQASPRVADPGPAAAPPVGASGVPRGTGTPASGPVLATAGPTPP